MEIRFDRKVGEHGILYGSVTTLDIVEALKERGHVVERRRVGLKEPIKGLGEYDIAIKLHREVSPTIKVLVRKEGSPDAAVAEAATEAAAGSEDTLESTPVDAAESAAAPDESEEPSEV